MGLVRRLSFPFLLLVILAMPGRPIEAQTPQHGVTLTWTASTSPTVTGYNVYRSTVTGGPYTKLTATPVSATTYFDPTASLGGQTLFYVVTAVDSLGVESSNSNQAGPEVAIGNPNPPSGLAGAIK